MNSFVNSFVISMFVNSIFAATVDIVLTLLIGAIIGFSAGMFGIGGALLSTPLLRLLVGLPAVLAVATPLPAAVPAAITGSIVYARQKMVRFDIAWRTLLMAFPLTVVGALLTGQTPDAVLMILTGLVLIWSAWSFIERGWKIGARGKQQPHPTGDPNRSSGVMYGAGALSGFLSGFLAIGGGIVLGPAFMNVAKLPTKTALATSLFCVACLSVPNTVAHGLEGNIHWPTALLLCCTSIPSSMLGARLATRLHSATLERIYGALMMAFAVGFTVWAMANG